jgi:carbon storage regulator
VLVLTRQTNQSIMIGNDVVVSVLDIRGDQVRLGIDAPRHLSVYREEIWTEVQSANREAANREAAGSPVEFGSMDGVNPPDPA